MLKRLMLFSSLILFVAGCSAENEPEEVTDENGTEEVIEETEDEEVDLESMTEEELEEYFASMSEEEINDYLAGLDFSEFVDEDGNPLFGEEGIQIYTEEDVLADLEAAYQESFQSEERGSGINPAAVGETMTKDIEIIDMASLEGDSLADPDRYPGKLEITHLGTVYGDEAWDILSEFEANLLFLDEPVDFDYVISEIEITMIEGEEDIGFLIPIFFKTTDYEGNTLAAQSPAALVDNPFLDLERESSDLYEGETVSGQLVTAVPKDVDFMLELMYDVEKYVFFEVE